MLKSEKVVFYLHVHGKIEALCVFVFVFMFVFMFVFVYVCHKIVQIIIKIIKNLLYTILYDFHCRGGKRGERMVR